MSVCWFEILRDPKAKFTTPTAQELYLMEPQCAGADRGVNHDLTLLGHDLSEVPEWERGEKYIDPQRFEVRILESGVLDSSGECCWWLATVWFDKKPVLVLQVAGKNGDHTRRYITDPGLFWEMVGYLNSLVVMSRNITTELVDAQERIPGMVDFFGHRLGDPFTTEMDEW